MGALSKGKLIFDPADTGDSDNIGAYLRAGSDGDLISSTLIGGKECLDVNVVGDADDGIFAEDAASANGDKGQFVLAVRQDSLASIVGADGDYAAFKLDARGGLWSVPVGSVADDAVDTENPVKVGSRAISGALAAVASGDRADLLSDLYRRVFVNDAPNVALTQTTVAVGTLAVALPTTAAAGRREIMVNNRSNNPVYIGGSGVTTAAGQEIPKGATLGPIRLGQAVPLYAIAGSAGNDVIVTETA